MKTTDLKVGDWALWKNKPVKVVRTWPFVLPFFGGDVIWIAPCNDEGNVECHNISEISYIPLTPQMLERNEWERSNQYMTKRTSDGLFYWMEDLGVVCYKNSYNMCTCKYVHQLQRAFRLCGFDNLADNFKI